jgi:hypothetical protein
LRSATNCAPTLTQAVSTHSIHTTMKKYILLILILLFIVLVIPTGFMLLTYKKASITDSFVEIIPQSIGGELVCKVEFKFPVGDYNIDYIYFDGKDSVNIGETSFRTRHWSKNEQLVKHGDWFFLITKASNNGNKILIGDKEMNNWRGFNINPESVENDSLWLDRKIHSINNWSASSLTFSEFYNGKIYFDFKYQVDENMENLFENSRLIYDISDESGDISLIDIRTLERIEAVD